MSPVGLSSLETRMKISIPGCYNFKKLSVPDHTIRALCNSGYFKNALLTILIAVSNVQVFPIPWYTYPVLRKHTLIGCVVKRVP